MGNPTIRAHLDDARGHRIQRPQGAMRARQREFLDLRDRVRPQSHAATGSLI